MSKHNNKPEKLHIFQPDVSFARFSWAGSWVPSGFVDSETVTGISIGGLTMAAADATSGLCGSSGIGGGRPAPGKGDVGERNGPSFGISLGTSIVGLPFVWLAVGDSGWLAVDGSLSER